MYERRQTGDHLQDLDREGRVGPKGDGCAVALMLIVLPVLLVIALAEWIARVEKTMR